MNKHANRFLEKYEAHASLSDRKHYAKRMPMSVSEYHRYGTDVYDYESFVKREPYVEMYIPQHKFEELVLADEYYARMTQQLDYVQEVVREKATEEALRKANPAVAKAYEKYRMLLELAKT